MKLSKDADILRGLFRLDFALRGHVAYSAPLTFDELLNLVERVGLSVGAPLLRAIDDRCR